MRSLPRTLWRLALATSIALPAHAADAKPAAPTSTAPKPTAPAAGVQGFLDLYNSLRHRR